MMDFLKEPEAWILLSFVLFLIGAVRFGRRAITGALDNRIARIRAEIETAESLRREAQALLDDYVAKQQSAAKDAEKIIENAKRHAERIHLQAEEDIKETVKRREQQMAERLHRMEEEAMQDIRAYAAEMAIKATAELIAAHMDEKTNARLVNDAIDDLKKDAA